METKKCKNCEKTFSIDQFRSWRETRRGKTNIRLSARCIECDREYDKERTKRRDKDKLKAASKKYQEKKRIERIERNPPKSNVYIRKCKDCGKYDTLKYEPKGIGIDYCKKHQARYRTKGKTLNIVDMESICPDCGCSHMAKRKSARCAVCAKNAANRWRKKNKKKRMAIMRGAKYGISFADKDIFKRDKWICKLCGCKVQKKDIYADNAAEIDHIVAVSKGGPHIPSNVQTLCRKCNIDKSNATIGQISLFVSVPESLSVNAIKTNDITHANGHSYKSICWLYL